MHDTTDLPLGGTKKSKKKKNKLKLREELKRRVTLLAASTLAQTASMAARSSNRFCFFSLALLDFLCNKENTTTRRTVTTILRGIQGALHHSPGPATGNLGVWPSGEQCSLMVLRSRRRGRVLEEAHSSSCEAGSAGHQAACWPSMVHFPTEEALTFRNT